MPAVPQRLERKQLTLIPEEERAICYRFDIALVGKGAKDFATRACESEMAEAFQPRSQRKKGGEIAPASEDDSENSSGSESPKKHCAGFEKDPICPTSYHANDGMVLFCPIGGSMTSKELARLRFQPIEQFSDSLPSSKKDATNQVVAFLFHEIDDDGGGLSPTEERIRDFASRMAEINHTPLSQRPYTTIMAFEAAEEQRNQLKSFVDRQVKVQVKLHFYEDDMEDTVMDCMQRVVDEMIDFMKVPRTEKCQTTAPPPKSRGCALM